MDFNQLAVFCLFEANELAGFIGVADRKIEMLFLLPQSIGKGLGKKLVQFAIAQLGADKVDVNEQNKNAVLFYERCGFVTYERTEKDNEGKDYPILKMQLR